MNPGNRCAIFVHGGAGYHSKEAEADHLRACRSASILAMAILKSGGTAVDAVEAAIKNLEDNELTNAGYGSNLTLTGNVECDATIIDHLGRSGSVGAVSNIKNPISLARVILDNSMRPRPIGLLPPNFLAGPGAAEYAYEHGFPILPNDFLVSPASKRSYEKHMNELQEEQKKRKEAEKEEEMNGFKYPLSPKNYSRWAGVPQSTFDAHQCTPQMPGAFSQSPTYMNGYLQPMEHTYGEPLQNQPPDYRFFIDGGGPPACGDGTKSVKVCASHHHCELDNSKSARPNTTTHGCPDAMHKVDKTQNTQPVTNLSEANLSFFNSNSDQGPQMQLSQ
ncbi:threonine aspartase 1 [Ascosphaera apis ARSEF 7405]|uniref:Threonine aspartase 1 n=1 Tax=Ascosphaera apis ARSEF 7405 TaxID=392613 RepID=A0A167X1I7_9EURO|nr:threonine aspartase 1 [Ascosphaera apis ARSEF 7405]